MSARPFRNSKGVNKPFRSPFNITPKNNVENKINTPESNTCQTPLRIAVSKKLHFETPTKKLCLSVENDDRQTNLEQNKELFQSDLVLLKKRIQEKQKAINSLKTTLLYKKKNKAEDLETAIKKWTAVCQTTLKDYQNNLENRNGHSMSMIDILSSFGIDPNIVCFSIDDNTFY